MVGALAVLGLILGFVTGWLAHRRISVKYKERWLQAVGMLNSKALETADLDTPGVGAALVLGRPVTPSALQPAPPYAHGRWALDERREGATVNFYAIRLGFDDVPLGSASTRYAGLYKMNRSNAEQEIAEMNQR